MMKVNSISKNRNKYKKIKYKRTEQTFQVANGNQEVYNIIDDTNIILITNINNQSDEKLLKATKKQLIKTLVDKESTFKRSFN